MSAHATIKINFKAMLSHAFSATALRTGPRNLKRNVTSSVITCQENESPGKILKSTSSGGLAGVVAGESSICTVALGSGEQVSAITSRRSSMRIALQTVEHSPHDAFKTLMYKKSRRIEVCGNWGAFLRPELPWIQCGGLGTRSDLRRSGSLAVAERIANTATAVGPQAEALQGKAAACATPYCSQANSKGCACYGGTKCHEKIALTLRKQQALKCDIA